MRKLAIALLLLLAGCGQSNPFDRIARSVANEPEYLVILDDMREEGAFITTYYHRYTIALGERLQRTDWLQVPKNFYEAHANHLGMALASKAKDGQPSTTPAPPGYAYVGNPRYGEWRTDSRGTSFWEFYGKYRLLTDLIGLGAGLIYRRDYDDYSRSRTQGRPYFGGDNQFGTGGRFTRSTKPDFFERRQARQAAQRSSFGERFNQRFDRSRAPVRVGGGVRGFGK